MRWRRRSSGKPLDASRCCIILPYVVGDGQSTESSCGPGGETALPWKDIFLHDCMNPPVAVDNLGNSKIDSY